jgi:acetyl esterase/lipase
MPEADRVAREICVRADAVVVSVDYRLAIGGVRYPVPLDDCVAALRWARDNADELGIDAGRIAVGGASAGGNLATGAALRLRDEDRWLPASLIPVYGVFHPGLQPASAQFAELMTAVPEVLRFRPGFTADINANYIGAPASAIPGYAMPALADLAGLCPTLVVNAEYDDLRASGEGFTALLAIAGVDVQQVQVRGMLHGFLNLPAEIGPVADALDLIAGQVARSRKPLLVT